MQIVLGMKPILHSSKADGGNFRKRLKRLVVNAAKRPVRSATLPSQDVMRVRRNDPLAIGIEELEGCLWPPTRSRLRLPPQEQQNN